MCRLAAYAGPPLPLRRLLLDPEHSLCEQAYAPQEMVRGLLCADGYGFGWYGNDNRPRLYTNALPIWSDTNLPDLAASLSAPVWLANVRSATPGQAVNLANTQPFRSDNLMYLHNGYLEGFNNGLRRQLHEHLDPGLSAALQGNCDSEYLFAMILQRLRDTGDIAMAMHEALADLEKLLAGRAALLGIVISDGERLYAIRHGIGCQPPSMYAMTDDPDYPGAIVIASERLTTSNNWQPVDCGRVMVAAAGARLAATA